MTRRRARRRRGRAPSGRRRRGATRRRRRIHRRRHRRRGRDGPGGPSRLRRGRTERRERRRPRGIVSLRAAWAKRGRPPHSRVSPPPLRASLRVFSLAPPRVHLAFRRLDVASRFFSLAPRVLRDILRGARGVLGAFRDVSRGGEFLGARIVASTGVFERRRRPSRRLGAAGSRGRGRRRERFRGGGGGRGGGGRLARPLLRRVAR